MADKKRINKDEGTAGMLPQYNPGSPKAKCSVSAAVELDDKVTLMVGRVSYMEGSIRRERLKCVQMCMDVAAGA